MDVSLPGYIAHESRYVAIPEAVNLNLYIYIQPDTVIDHDTYKIQFLSQLWNNLPRKISII